MLRGFTVLRRVALGYTLGSQTGSPRACRAVCTSLVPREVKTRGGFVIKRIGPVAFALLALLTFSGSAAGQAPACYVLLTAHDLGIDLGVPAPPWAKLVWQNNVSGLGGWSIYKIFTNLCSPPAPCPDCGAQGGRPIQFATGNIFITETDVNVPGLGGGLSLVRKWNSAWDTSLAGYSSGQFGPNWRSTYEEAVFVGSDYYLKYLRGDGSVWSFGTAPGGVWMPAAPANASATLLHGASAWVLTFQNGEQRRFDLATGHLTSIIDRNGNSTQLSYDNLNRLVTVTSPALQHLYFNYPSGSSYLVTSVTSDFGVTLSYSYDAAGRLNQVTWPDQTTVSFTYNAQSQITQVTDSNGKILESHTYDAQGRGLTSSQANGVNSISVTYPNPPVIAPTFRTLTGQAFRRIPV
jgi:YD repeat-containing protein